jgi:endonuclease G, mitochondrial
MIKLIYLLFLFFSIPAQSQDIDCKKLTSKKTGGTGNKCCIDNAKIADQRLIEAQNYIQDIQKLHAPFGVPKSKNKNIHILYAPGYICGYDTVLNIPIWVQYRFWDNQQWDEDLRRQNCFRQDPRLDISQQIKHSDFTGSGFDRGHIKPANDAKLNQFEHYNSFLMTNMAPQYGKMNQQEWKAIEAYVNALSRKDSIRQAYMITGSVVGHHPKMINNKIAIPSWFYKIYFFQNQSYEWDYWVFYVKNDNELSDIRDFEKELKENSKSIDELEVLTGTNFKVSRRNQRKIEKENDTSHLVEGMFKFGYSSSYTTKL